MTGAARLLLAAALCAPVPLAAQAAWRRLPVDGHAPFDRGTGLLHFREPPGARGRPDTLVLRAAPRPDAEVAALFLCELRGPHEWAYALAAREALVANVVEFDYETAGVATDSAVTVDGRRWLRVIVGARDAAGRGVRHAWAEVDTARVTALAWADFLPTLQGVFALDPGTAQFAKRPGGPRVASPFRRGADPQDHWMEVRARRGAWLEVRFLQPAAACGDEPPPDQVARVLWVRFLDARGRPAVWYYTRGC